LKFQKYWRLCYVPQIAVLIREPHRNRDRLANLKGIQMDGDLANNHQGNISPNAKRKIRNAILWLDASAKWKWCYSNKTKKWFRWRLNFIHLTLPKQQGKSDKFIKKLLNRFFQMAYRKTGMRSYVWKAEPQQRGEIHFHITSDCYIYKDQLQNIWNGSLKHFGLIDYNDNPPSTRVHPTHNIVLMTAYLVKYLTKNDESRRTIQGRLWGCSRNLSQANNFHITFPEEELGGMCGELSDNSVRVDAYDWVHVFNLQKHYFENLEECEVKNLYREKIRSIQKGYVADKTFFYDGKGQPLTLEEATTIGIKETDKMLYHEQINLF